MCLSVQAAMRCSFPFCMLTGFWKLLEEQRVSLAPRLPVPFSNRIHTPEASWSTRGYSGAEGDKEEREARWSCTSRPRKEGQDIDSVVCTRDSVQTVLFAQKNYGARLLGCLIDSASFCLYHILVSVFKGNKHH